MSKINYTRVLLGGLLAGVVLNFGEYVINEVILGEKWRAALASLNRTPPAGGAIAVFVLMTFLLGLIAVWLYAAIRPRFGPGPKTAVVAGLFLWLVVWVWTSVGYMAMDLFATDFLLISIVWGLFEMPIATVAGAWLYQEA